MCSLPCTSIPSNVAILQKLKVPMIIVISVTAIATICDTTLTLKAYINLITLHSVSKFTLNILRCGRKDSK